MNWLKVLPELKHNTRTERMPLLLLLSREMKHDLEQAREIGLMIILLNLWS